MSSELVMKLHLVVISLICFLFALASSVYASKDAKDPYLYDESAFNQLVPTKPHFVLFFAPGSEHYKAMKDDWNQLTEYYKEKDSEMIKIVKVDCDADKRLCESMEVKDYPAIKLFLPGKESIRYEAKKTFDELEKFVTESLAENIDSTKSKAKITDVPKKPVDGMYNLTRRNFYHKTMRGDSFVMFFQDGSDLSSKVEGTWKKVAKFYEDNENVQIGMVDCVKETFWKSQGLLGFPALKYYHDGNEIESHPVLDNADRLISYVQRKLENPPAEVKGDVKILTNETIQKVLTTGVTFLKLYHPTCGFCKRMERAWKQLSMVDFSSAAGPVTIAEMNCQEYETACLENGVRDFPTLLLFMNGDVVARYTSPRNWESMRDFVLQTSNGYEKKDHFKDEL